MAATETGNRQLHPVMIGIFVGLVLWSLYLAVGATGWFADAGLWDLRRSLWVLFCSIGFVAIWAYVLSRRGRTPASGALTVEPGWTPASGDAVAPRPINRASWISLLAASGMWFCWAAAWWAWLQPAWRAANAPLGWLAAALFLVAAISAVVGLSDPVPKRHQLLALLTLLLLAAAVVAFVVQLQHHKRNRIRPPSSAAVSAERIPGLRHRGHSASTVAEAGLAIRQAVVSPAR